MKEELLYKEKLNKEKKIKYYRKIIAIVIVVLFLEFIYSNNIYLCYIFNQDSYNLCNGKIKEIDYSEGRYSFPYHSVVSYNLDEVMYEKKCVYNIGDHEGDTITIIIKGDKIGRCQFVLGCVFLCGISLIVLVLLEYYIEYSQLKKLNLL